MAEADFLYPVDYFRFQPQEDKFYCVRNVYILWKNRHRYYRKFGSEGALICHREKLMEYMESYLKGWDEDIVMRSILFHPNKEWIKLENPVVSFKTGRGMHLRCPYYRKEVPEELPYWGKADRLRGVYF